MMITRSITMKGNDSTNSKYKQINLIQLNLSKSYVRKPKLTKELEPIVYSLKPLKYSIPKDVCAIEIMQTMKSNKSLTIKNAFLKMTPIEKNQRRIYIEKLKLFIICENFPYAIVSYSIYFMDILISKKSPIPIEHIFIGSMLLAIKYYSINTRLLLLRRIQKFMKDTCGVIYTIEELNQIEIYCLKQLEYKLNWVHASHFIQLLLLNGVLFNIDTLNKTDPVNSNIYDLIYTMLDTLYEGDKYFSQDPFHLSCACVAVAREIYGFTPWSIILEKVCSISLFQFDYCFDFVKEYYTGQKQNQTPQKQHYVKKIILTIPNPRKEEIRNNSILRTENTDTKHKGIYYKSKSLEINKNEVEDFIYTQRTMCHKPKQLSIIRENDINSTKDNSFGTMIDMNQNKTSYYHKEINAYNNQGRPGVISLNNSSNNIVKQLNFNQIEEKYKKVQLKQSDNSKPYTTRKLCDSMDFEQEGKKLNQIGLVKHSHTKSVININDKSYLTGIKRLLRENKNSNLFENFEAVKKSDRTFCASNQKK